MSPVPTDTPAARSARPKSTRTRTSAASSITTPWTVISSRFARTSSRSSRSLMHRAERVSRRPSAVRSDSPRNVQGPRPVDGLRDARAAWPGPSRAAGGPRRRPCGPAPGRRPGWRTSDDLDLALGAGVVDPVVQAAALERVVQLPGAVRGEDDQRRPGRRVIVPISGMLIWKSESSSSRNASNSSSARSISSMSSTARSPARTACSSGRSSRNRGPKSWSTRPRRSAVLRSDSARICSSWRA